MATLIELCNAPKGTRYLMEMFKAGKKVAEDDISDKTSAQIEELIELQEMQGRTWTYRTIPYPYAEFIGNQDDYEGGTLAYYNIVGGPKNGATVTARILRELGIEIPEEVER